MLERLEINNFRGIKKLNFDSFKNINIFTGKANVGKTSVLEAIYTILKLNPASMIEMSNLRAIVGYDDIFKSLFYDYNLKNSIKLNSTINNKKEEKINIEIRPNINNKSITVPLDTQTSENDINFLNSLQFDIKNGKTSASNIIVEKINNTVNFQVLSTDKIKIDIEDNVEFIAEYYNKNNLHKNLKNILEKKKEKEELHEYCKQFNDNIKDIRFIDNKIVIETSNLEHTLNLKIMGKGFQTYMTIIASMVAGHKYILIDEIENGIHYEIMNILVDNMINLSKKYELQFFITTHSKEFLQTLNKFTKNNDYSDMISVFNLYHDKEKDIKVVKFTQENFSHFMKTDSEIRD